MRDHVLLQAIARVNRPYEDDEWAAKPCGFVLDFVGIFEKLEKALAFDSDVVASVIREQHRRAARPVRDDDARARDGLPTAHARHGRQGQGTGRRRPAGQGRGGRRFSSSSGNLQSLYDILSPDVTLRPFIDDYNVLAVLFAWIGSYSDRVYVDQEFTAKRKRCSNGTRRAVTWRRRPWSTKSGRANFWRCGKAAPTTPWRCSICASCSP